MVGLRSVFVVVSALAVLFVSSFSCVASPRFTHADAAVAFAKHSGQFDRYVSADADVGECVQFLNRIGVFFDLKSVIAGKEFTESDCARVMGQISLVFGGKADFVHGKAGLPFGVQSWEDYCVLYGVEYKKAHQAMLGIRDNA